jgi:diguanylate cyclase (GGDEF)-like protein
VLLPSAGARANAAEALDEMNETGGVVVHGADLALLSGHPAGLSQRRAAGRLGTALWEVFPGHVALLDRDGDLVSINQAWRRFGLDNGASPATGLGMNYLDVCARAAAEGEPEAAEAGELVRLALAGIEPDRRLRYQCAGRWFSLEAVPLPGRHSGALVVHTDVTTDTEDVQRWRHQALHDPLTGLPNRLLLEDRLRHAIDRAERDPRLVAVLFIDVDDFKSVNDRHGHGAGDAVLQEVTARMADSLRAGDTLGRWGGDEFLVIAEQLADGAAARELAERVRASCTGPIEVDGVEIPVGLSVGLAHVEPGQPPHAVIAAADQALQHHRKDRRQSGRRPPRQRRGTPAR